VWFIIDPFYETFLLSKEGSTYIRDKVCLVDNTKKQLPSASFRNGFINAVFGHVIGFAPPALVSHIDRASFITL
jgi:hypothetical protein